MTKIVPKKRGSGRHLGFLSDLGEFRFKMWLDSNAEEALREIGVGEDIRVLDYGCGPGKFTIPTSRMVGRNGVVYALDIDDKALQTIRRLAESQGLTNINYIHWSEGSELPIDSHSLDLVLLIDVMQEIPDWDRLFRILTSLLKIGGIIAVFPMHVSVNEVIDTATRTGLSYQGRAVKEKFLTFRAQAL